MNDTMNYYFTIHLAPSAYEDGQKFASQQADAQKARQVYFNTLAVLAVNQFVQEQLGFTTDVKAGDCWNPVVRMVHDVADLVIPDLGIIECRIMQGDLELISLPTEVQENRIAYVVVQFAEEDKVKLIGFISAVELGNLPKQISVVRLQTIEYLIDLLSKLEIARDSIQSIVEEELETAEEIVRDKLKNISIKQIVEQLEYVYRNFDSSDWWDEGGRALAGGFVGVGGGVRESSLKENLGSNENGEIELSDFAEELLEKLAEIWGNDA